MHIFSQPLYQGHSLGQGLPPGSGGLVGGISPSQVLGSHVAVITGEDVAWAGVEGGQGTLLRNLTCPGLQPNPGQCLILSWTCSLLAAARCAWGLRAKEVPGPSRSEARLAG